MSIPEVKQEIKDLFARNGDGTLQEAAIIDSALDELLQLPEERDASFDDPGYV